MKSTYFNLSVARTVCMKTILILSLFCAIAQADTLRVALPCLTGSYTGSTMRSCSFDLGVRLDSIISVQIKWRGTVTPGVGHGDGVEMPNNGPFAWPAKMEARMPADTYESWNSYTGYAGGAFDTTTMFSRSSSRASWQFLLDGTGELQVYISSIIMIGGTMVQAPTAVIDSIELIIVANPSATGTHSKPVYNPTYSKAFLYQNFPDPFRYSTKIRFDIADVTMVDVRIFNAAGREIAAFLNRKCTRGTNEITWDAKNMPSGVYWCRLETDCFSQCRRMSLIR